MSITTTYKCDRCGAEQSTPEQFWTVGVVAKALYGQIYRDEMPDSKWRMQVCRNCCEQMGMISQEKATAEPAEKTTPTLEDLIREIVQAAIEERG